MPAVDHRRPRVRDRRAALALAAVLAAASPARAAEVEWLFRGSGFWDDAANWLEGAPPGPQDDVLVSFGSGNQPAVVRQRPGEAATSVYRVRSLAALWPVQLQGGILTASGAMSFGAGLDWRGGSLGLGDAATTASFQQGFTLTTSQLVGLNVVHASLSGASVIDTRGAAAGTGAGLIHSGGGSVVLESGASLDLLGEAPRLVVQGALDLRGSLSRSSGSGTAELWFSSGGGISGQVQVDSGTLALIHTGGAGGITHSGRLRIGAGSTLRVTPGQTFNGSLDGAGTLKLALAGLTQIRTAGWQLQGTLDMDPGAQLAFTGPGEAVVSTLRQGGATLRPQDRLTVQQRVQSSALLVLDGAASSTTTFAQGAEVAVGLSVFNGHLVLGGGTTTIAAGQFLGLGAGSTLRVAPEALLQLDGGHLQGSPQGPVLGGGLLQVQGRLARSAQASGPGLVGAVIVNEGLIDLAGGQLTLQSAFTQTATGTLRLRLTGDDDPRLVLQGEASFAGSLQLELADGFTLQPGQRVALLRWGAHHGTLALDAASAALAPGLPLALQADDQALWLSVANAPVPEPQTWALWLAGLGLGITRLCRRRG